MKNIKFASIPLLVSACLALSGCGNNDSSSKSASAPASSGSAAKTEHHEAFEAKYADMCVKQEVALRKQEHQALQSADEGLKKLCACIAAEEAKHLTKQEAKKFVEENEYPMSLMIKAGQAEEICSRK